MVGVVATHSLSAHKFLSSNPVVVPCIKMRNFYNDKIKWTWSSVYYEGITIKLNGHGVVYIMKE